jgi:hypothetical protein
LSFARSSADNQIPAIVSASQVDGSWLQLFLASLESRPDPSARRLSWLPAGPAKLLARHRRIMRQIPAGLGISETTYLPIIGRCRVAREAARFGVADRSAQRLLACASCRCDRRVQLFPRCDVMRTWPTRTPVASSLEIVHGSNSFEAPLVRFCPLNLHLG